MEIEIVWFGYQTSPTIREIEIIRLNLSPLSLVQ
jgi:hypothetical protein